MAIEKITGVQGNSFSIGLKTNKTILTVDGTNLSIDKKISVNEIIEKTTDAGVTIEGVLIKDGLVDGIDISAIATHIQNTDTGTTGSTFEIDSDGTAPIKIKNNAGVLELKNATDDAYIDLKVKDLTVSGTTTTINSTNLQITDNIILLNKDETGAGVTLGSAGIQIERGSVTNASLIFDETSDKFKAGLLSAEVELVDLSATQTLTGKTIDGDDNTLQDIGIASLKTVLGDANKFIRRDAFGVVVSDVIATGDLPSSIDASKIGDGSVSTTEFQYINSLTSNAQTQITAKANSIGTAKHLKFTVNLVTGASTASIPTGATIEQVKIVIKTAYDGTTPALNLLIGEQNIYSNSFLDVATPDTYISNDIVVVTSGAVCSGTITGTDITTGSADIYITFVETYIA